MRLLCGKYIIKFHDMLLVSWLEVLVGHSLFFCLESRPFMLVVDTVERGITVHLRMWQPWWFDWRSLFEWSHVL